MASGNPLGTKPGIRVLIADDHVLFRRGLREHLEASGLEVVGEASNIKDAEALARQTGPEVVLLDIRMSGGPPWMRP